MLTLGGSLAFCYVNTVKGYLWELTSVCKQLCLWLKLIVPYFRQPSSKCLEHIFAFSGLKLLSDRFTLYAVKQLSIYLALRSTLLWEWLWNSAIYILPESTQSKVIGGSRLKSTAANLGTSSPPSCRSWMMSSILSLFFFCLYTSRSLSSCPNLTAAETAVSWSSQICWDCMCWHITVQLSVVAAQTTCLSQNRVVRKLPVHVSTFSLLWIICSFQFACNFFLKDRQSPPYHYFTFQTSTNPHSFVKQSLSAGHPCAFTLIFQHFSKNDTQLNTKIQLKFLQLF